MRVKLSGRLEVIEALEIALQSTAGATLVVPMTRREDAEMRFGVKEIAELVTIAAYSGHSGHPFRRKPAIHSGPFQPSGPGIPATVGAKRRWTAFSRD